MDLPALFFFGKTIHRARFLIPISFSTELFNQGEERRVGAGGVKAEIDARFPPHPLRGTPATLHHPHPTRGPGRDF